MCTITTTRSNKLSTHFTDKIMFLFRSYTPLLHYQPVCSYAQHYWLTTKRKVQLLWCPTQSSTQPWSLPWESILWTGHSMPSWSGMTGSERLGSSQFQSLWWHVRSLLGWRQQKMLDTCRWRSRKKCFDFVAIRWVHRVVSEHGALS